MLGEISAICRIAAKGIYLLSFVLDSFLYSEYYQIVPELRPGRSISKHIISVLSNTTQLLLPVPR